MKFITFIFAAFSMALAVNSRRRIRSSIKNNEKKKGHFEHCTHQTFGSECADGLVCDVFEFSYAKQALVYVDKVGHDTTKGRCKILVGKPCNLMDAQTIGAPCKSQSICQPGEKSGICTARSHNSKVFEGKMTPEEIETDNRWKKRKGYKTK